MIPFGMLVILSSVFFTGRRKGVDTEGRPIVVYAHPPCGPELMKLYRPIWEEFKRTHPDIDFRVLHISGKYEDKIKVMFAGNVAPDVIFMYPKALPAWADMDALEPLDEYLAKSEKISRDDYFPAMLETFTYNGKLYGLPKDASATLMFYNVDMFKKYGLEKPRADWTWEDLVNSAKAMTHDTNGDGRVDQWGLTSPRWWELVWQFGGRILDENAARCMLLEPKALAGLEFWAALRNKYGVTPSPEALSDIGDSRLFSLGKVGMFFGIYPWVSSLRKECDFRWDIALVPRGPSGRAVTAFGSAMAVTCQSRNKTAAFEWVRWMTQRTGMIYLTSVENPSCLNLAKSRDFLDSLGLPSTKEVAVEALEYVRPPMRHPRHDEIMDALDAELYKAQLGTITIRQALENAVPKVNRILQRESNRKQKTK